jgi:hypothetical protein
LDWAVPLSFIFARVAGIKIQDISMGCVQVIVVAELRASAIEPLIVVLGIFGAATRYAGPA